MRFRISEFLIFLKRSFPSMNPAIPATRTITGSTRTTIFTVSASIAWARPERNESKIRNTSAAAVKLTGKCTATG